MMLWDIIRDFFVEYIFGGFTSNGTQFAPNIGMAFVNHEDAGYTELYSMFGTDLTIFKTNFILGDDNNVAMYMSLGDWLSTTATIITLCAICVFLFFFVRWLFRLTAGLVSGRG